MELTLSLQERQILAETLSNQHRHLQQQIVKTDYASARAMLREREQVLEAVLKKLQEN
jgi:hypothetical protein